MPWVPGVPATSTGYQLLVDGVNVLPYVPIDEQPIRWEDEAGNSVASMTFLAEDTKSWATRLPLDTGADVRFRDVANDVTLFGGTLVRRVDSPRAVSGRWSECTVVSYESWLDWRIAPRWDSKADINGRNRKLLTDRAMVQDVIENRCGMLRAPNATVDLTNSSVPPFKLAGLTVRGVLEEIADHAQTDSDPGVRRYYVDYERRLHWYKGKEGGAAPVTVSLTDGGGSIVVEDLSLEWDAIDQVHHVYVRGKNNAGSGWVYNKGSDFQLGARHEYIDRHLSDTVNERNRAGRGYIRRHGRVRSGRFHVEQTDGWKAGQQITITEPSLGLSSDTFEIVRVSGEFSYPNVRAYDIEFGAARRSFVKEAKRHR